MLGADTVTTITLLAALVIGSGTGGVVGAVLTVKRFQVERQDSEVKRKVDLQSVDVEQFKAMFPGGLGDAVEHWRDEARSLYVEVDELREQRGRDHDQIIQLKSELAQTKRELAGTQRELESTQRKLETTSNRLEAANGRIAELERRNPHE
jgi:chromosome segregation ATPase